MLVGANKKNSVSKQSRDTKTLARHLEMTPDSNLFLDMKHIFLSTVLPSPQPWTHRAKNSRSNVCTSQPSRTFTAAMASLMDCRWLQLLHYNVLLRADLNDLPVTRYITFKILLLIFKHLRELAPRYLSIYFTMYWPIRYPRYCDKLLLIQLTFTLQSATKRFLDKFQGNKTFCSWQCQSI